MNYIGVNVIEVDGVGAPAIVGAAASVGAFNILTWRGVPNTPIRVDSYPKFVERFGTYFDQGLGAYLVKGFFDNGGRTAYINRVVAIDAATGHAPASITLPDGAPANTLTVTAGYRGDEDPGSWGDDLYISVRHSSSASSRLASTAAATITGTVALPATVDMSAFPPLSIRIDEEATATDITFQASDFPGGAATATRAQIRDAINARTNKLVATLNGSNQLVLTSTGEVASLSGGWTSLQVTANNTTLGFTAAATPTYGTPAATAVGGTTLNAVEVFDVGDAVQITDGTNTAIVKLLSINEITRAVTWTPDVTGIAGWDQRLIMVSNLEFDLTVAYGSSEAEDVVETFTGLSMESDVPNYAPAKINDTINGSKYITVKDENSASSPGNDRPAATTGLQRLNPGRDGTPTANDFIGSQANRTGFYAFDSHNVQLICCERTDSAITTAALSYCAGRGDCMYVGAVPEGFVQAGQAVNYGKAFQGKKVYGALYSPWIQISDPIGVGDNPIKTIPPVGHVMGVYARIESNRGVWKAPAGDEANLRGVLDVAYRLSDGEHTNLVKNGSVNGIRAIPRAGIVVDSSRTLSTDTRWFYVNVRLLFNYVKSSLRDGLRWVRQEPNRVFLWNTIKYNSVTPFLMGLWRRGAFGTGEPEEVFTVICDESNNPPEEVDQGNLYVEVYFYPSKPAETIIIKVGQQPSGASVSES